MNLLKLFIIFFTVIACNIKVDVPLRSSNTAIDVTAPVISSVSAPNNGSYKQSQNLNFTVNFSEAVNVVTTGGVPRLQLTIGGNTRYADYVSGSGQSSLIFRYTVQPGEDDADGIEVELPLDLNGGSIKDLSNNSLVLMTFLAPITTAVLVDNTAPSLNSVQRPANATYTVSQNLDFIVSMSETVTVSTTLGTPRIALDVGGNTRYANYFSGSGSSSLVFRYTVQATEMDLDGVTYASPLDLNGGVIQDAATNNLSAFIFTPDNNPGVVVNTTVSAPSIASIVAPSNGTYLTNPGVPLEFTVNFSENIIVTGTPGLTLEIGGLNRKAEYVSGTGTTGLVFRYTPDPADSDSDGIALNSNWDFSTGSLGNASSVAVSSTIVAPVIPNLSLVFVNRSPSIDSIAFTNGTYIYNQNLDFTVTFSEAVIGTTSRLAFDLDGTTAYADYLSGSGTTTLVYRWTNNPGGVTDSDGITLISPLDLNGGTLKDANSNDAVLAFPLPNTSAVLISGILPPVDLNYYSADNFSFFLGAPQSGLLYPQVLSGNLPSAFSSTNLNSRLNLNSSTGVISFPDTSGIPIEPTSSTITGANEAGSDTTPSITFKALPMIEKNKIAVGTSHACAIANGGVYCWGSNTAGQLGYDPTTGAMNLINGSGVSCGNTSCGLPIQVIAPGSGVREISAGGNRTCVITKETKIICWGNGDFTPKSIGSTSSDGEPTTEISSLAVSGNFACYLRLGKAYCWGQNGSGQLGVGDKTTPMNTPQLVIGGHTFHKIAVGVDHACALEGKFVWCWGENSSYQLGDGTTTDGVSPLQPNSSGIASEAQDIQLGNGFTCVLNFGTVYCWGRNDQNQLGRNTTSVGMSVPSPYADNGIATETNISKLSIHSEGDFVSVIKNGEGWAWGALVRLKSNSTSSPQHFINPSGFVSEVVAGPNILFYLANKTTQTGWFTMLANASSQAGTGIESNDQDNILLTFDTTASYQGIFAGFGNTCVHVSSTPHCFGRNRSGELTLKTGQPDFLPTNAIFDPLLSSFTNSIITRSVHGDNFSCYSNNTNKLICAGFDRWGFGVLGIGGDGVGESNPKGTEVTLNEVSRKICASDKYACSLSILGNVECWGENRSQINADVDNNAYFASPTSAISSMGAIDLACLANDICILTEDQNIYCKGQNAGAAPTQVLTARGENYIQLKGAGDYFCGTTATGKLICGGWDNTYSQLADKNVVAPISLGVLVASNDILSIINEPVFSFETGPKHACATTAKNRTANLWCWGDNSNGQVNGVSPQSAVCSGFVGGGVGAMPVQGTCVLQDPITGSYPTPPISLVGFGADKGGILDIALSFSHTCFQIQGGISCMGSSSEISLDYISRYIDIGVHPILPLFYRETP